MGRLHTSDGVGEELILWQFPAAWSANLHSQDAPVHIVHLHIQRGDANSKEGHRAIQWQDQLSLGNDWGIYTNITHMSDSDMKTLSMRSASKLKCASASCTTVKTWHSGKILHAWQYSAAL